jgi:hypothetical protein
LNVFDGDARFLVRLVREQDAAGDVANGVNARVVGLLVMVDLDETFFVQLHLGVFQAEIGAVGHAANGDQHAVVKFGEFLAVVFGLHFDLLADGGHFGHAWP